MINEDMKLFNEGYAFGILTTKCKEYFGEDLTTWRFKCPCCDKILDFDKIYKLIEEKIIDCQMAHMMFLNYKYHGSIEKLES